MQFKIEVIKFCRRLLFVMLIPIMLSTGLILTQKAFNTHDMYIGITVGTKDND